MKSCLLLSNTATNGSVQSRLWGFCCLDRKEFVIERIQTDPAFFNYHLPAVKHFLIYGVLPEIIGKYYTRKPVADSSGIVPVTTPSTEPSTNHSTLEDDRESDDVSTLWCYCSQPSFGDMIMCDNDKCTIKWFHFECLRIRCAPKGKWYCPLCCKLSKFSRKKS